jgi:hypothetical protein
MRRTFFLSIMHKLSEISPYFSEMYDTTSHVGLTTLQKCTVVVRQLAYCSDIIEYFGAGFLRRPTITDT